MSAESLADPPLLDATPVARPAPASARAPRILIVSHWFPPYAAIGALRVGKLAQHLEGDGWDVRVIAAQLPLSASLPLEIAAERVTYTDWREVDRLLDDVANAWPLRVLLGRHETPPTAAPSAAVAGAPERRAAPVRDMLRKTYLSLVRWPDSRAGWFKPAVAAGAELIGHWRPDVIYGSAPPVTAILIADALGRRFDIPWVAEFRDLWTDHPYYEYQGLRRLIEKRWEKRVLARAAAIVTVSPTWQQAIARRFGRPAVLAMNGMVAGDFPETPPVAPARTGPVGILYTGHLYVGHRDPTPLFKAIARLGPLAGQVHVTFVGTQVEAAREIAERLGVAGHVTVQGPVPYRQSLALQLHADVLLHLHWDDPRESGTIAGKLFEYLGARRPILGIGYGRGAAADLIEGRGAGVMTNDPQRIEGLLRGWIEQKASGGIAPTPPSAVEGLSRADQFARVARLLGTIIARPAPRKAAVAARDPIGFLQSRRYRPLSTAGWTRPQLMLLVDVEEEFDWAKPFARDRHAVQSLDLLAAAHAAFRARGMRPAYLVDYPVIATRQGAELFRDWTAAGECILGAQLHPWVNPPFEEDLVDANTYPGNLPFAQERRKLALLTETIAAATGHRPRVYRAGRYGLGPNTIEILEGLGYDIDVSLVPYTDFRSQAGPDFSSYGAQPFWFGHARDMLELPVTRGFTGLARAAGPAVFERLQAGAARTVRASGVAARLGLLERITLTPEGINLAEMIRLAERMIADGTRLLGLSFHSPSLLAGATPYVRTEAEARAFLDSILHFIDHFAGMMGGELTDPLSVRDRFRGSDTDAARTPPG